ncbi:MAG: FtsX-like permease family protein [Candidatus Latescibacteria bacterium]|nr:FtsX-like permease family protein [Candidatus Latescibacterota bacterium]
MRASHPSTLIPHPFLETGMKNWKIIALVVLVTALFVPIAVFSPDTVTAHLIRWFNIRPPASPPKKTPPDQRVLVASIQSSVTEAQVRDRLTRLSGVGSRVVGYPGHEAAYRYLLEAFQRIGLERVTSEPYDVTSPVDKGGQLRVVGDSLTIPLHAVWPNLVRTSTLPPEGLRLRLIDGGRGDFADFNGKDVEGSAVLMAFNSWNNWMNASMLGAKAVIFVAPDSTTYTEAEQKFFQVPLNVPRFWIAQAEGERLRQRLASGGQTEVEMHSRMVWEKHPAHNVIGWIPGRDPVLKNQVILFDAYYDAMSVVPALAPGAEQASGIAGLLEMAEYLRAHPPARTVLFLASSGHHLGFRGVCDFLSRHARKEEHFVKLVAEPIDIRLWVSLDLSSQTDEMGVWNGSSYYYFQRFFAPFGKRFSDLGEEFAPAFGLDKTGSLVDGITPPSGMSWNMFIPGGVLKTDSEVVLNAGMPTLAFVTINDARFSVDTPFDTVERVNLPNLTRQIQLLTAAWSKALDDPELLPDYRVNLQDNMRALKGRILTFPRRSIVPDRPRVGAVAVLRMTSEKSVKGVRTIFYDMANEKGEFYIPGVAVRWVGMDAYYLDPETGEITYAPDRGQSAKIYKPEFGMDFWITRATRILFPCISTDFYETVDPRYLSKLPQLSVYGEGNVAPQEYGYTLGYGPNEPVGVVFTRPGEKVKLTMSAGSIGIRFVLLNSIGAESEEQARGRGFTTLTHGSFARTSFQAAKDMWTLDEARMRDLKAYAIENQRLNVLHAQAKAHVDLAEQAFKGLKWDEFIKHTRAALGVESRAYPDVKATQNDVIQGIIFFMALVIPCAFFAERLLITAGDIRWQVVGFSAIFVVIWIFLSFVHPAFDLSNPFVILLAFVILALAIFVITLIFTRFNAQMRKLRTEAAVIHDVDVGRVSASLAAFQLGIANMKRRKLRTVLTFSTLVLLTFTVLSFTSIKSSLRFHQIARDNPGQYPGFLLRSKFWGALEETSLDYTRASFAGEAIIAPRSWYSSRDKKAIKLKHGEKSANALGIVGLSAQEAEVTQIQSCLYAGRWFREGEQKVCVVPREMAKLLGLTPEDVGRAQVRLFGDLFTVAGLIDSDRMKGLRDLDDEPLTPADFEATDQNIVIQMSQQERREKAGLEEPDVEIMEFVHLDPANVLIVPYQTLREVRSPLQAVAVRFRDPTVVKSRVEDFISRLSVVLFAGVPRQTRDEQIERLEGWDLNGTFERALANEARRNLVRVDVSIYSSLGQTSLKGMSNLFIPIAIAALIVLNTMMGSVYERFREIGIYSSVGLAPVHIAFLFMAESCVYAVLGTVSGYLLGQGVAKVLLWQGLLEGITLNYSALSAVASSGLVMAVVILSTIYPARKASQMAVPDVTRRWKLPDPHGDRWDFEFPFTVGGREVFGLCVFLVKYFDFHTEGSMGTFYTEGAQLSALPTDKGDGYTIRTTIWLSPFDLGVSQTVLFKAVPTGNHDIHAMELTLGRLSGDASSWKRCNQRFMNVIRKQFLIWRTISTEAKDQYKAEGQRMIEAQEKERVIG